MVFLTKKAGSYAGFCREKLRLKLKELNQQKEERQGQLQMIAHQHQAFAAMMQQMNCQQATA